MKFQTRLTAVIILALSSQAFALSVGPEIEKNLCTNNCISDAHVTVSIAPGQECKRQYIDGRHVTCCEAVPKNRDLSDEKILNKLVKDGSFGLCSMSTDLYMPWSLCSANGCEEVEYPESPATLVAAFRKANATGACERTIYTNGIYLRKGESVSLNAYRSMGKDLPSTTISCQ